MKCFYCDKWHVMLQYLCVPVEPSSSKKILRICDIFLYLTNQKYQRFPMKNKVEPYFIIIYTQTHT